MMEQLDFSYFGHILELYKIYDLSYAKQKDALLANSPLSLEQNNKFSSDSSLWAKKPGPYHNIPWTMEKAKILAKR